MFRPFFHIMLHGSGSISYHAPFSTLLWCFGKSHFFYKSSHILRILVILLQVRSLKSVLSKSIVVWHTRDVRLHLITQLIPHSHNQRSQQLTITAWNEKKSWKNKHFIYSQFFYTFNVILPNRVNLTGAFLHHIYARGTRGCCYCVVVFWLSLLFRWTSPEKTLSIKMFASL